MGRPKNRKQAREPYQRRANSSSRFVRLFHDMLDSVAFHELTAKQKELYVYCLREAHGKATADDPNHDETLFYMNRAQAVDVHGLYSKKDFRGLRRDMAALVSHGFVDVVRNGYATREKTLYRLSGRWNNWGSEAFSMPESVKSTHMLIEQLKGGANERQK